MPGDRVKVAARVKRKKLQRDMRTLGEDDGFTGIYISKLIKFYALNICRLLYVNYNLIKLLFLKRWK